MGLFRRLVVAAGAAMLLGVAMPAQGVILYKSAIRNKSAPTGTLANSGWQWQGNWANGFTGTPIASQYFIAGAHAGGGVGQNIFINGKNYMTTAAFDDPSTDLIIYKIAGKFSSWAPIYTGSSETNMQAVVFGRGTGRGDAVTVNKQLKGWKWATQDKVRSWGTNLVAGNVNGGTGIGSVLDFTFSKNGTANEGALSGGDSGGGVFIDVSGKWELAGVNYLVDGPFSTTSTGSTFNASLFDKGGLYVQGKLTADTTADVPGNWYATRISSRASWIKSIIGSTSAASISASALSINGTSSVPEPATIGLIAVAATAMLRRRQKSNTNLHE